MKIISPMIMNIEMKMKYKSEVLFIGIYSFPLQQILFFSITISVKSEDVAFVVIFIDLRIGHEIETFALISF